MQITVERKGDVEFVSASNVPAGFEEYYYDKSPAFFFVGYGAMRVVDVEGQGDVSSRRKLRHNRYERVASLFEDQYTLSPLSSWLPMLRRRQIDRFREVVDLINRLLPSPVKMTEEFEDGEYLFSFRGTKIPFGALSDGYRAYLGWISDLLNHLCVACPKKLPLADFEGVVMVDEIDLHIHPDWQRTQVPKVARTFPALQFIFTTHSPLVVGTLESQNLWIVELARGRPTVSRPGEEVFGLSVDQILRSDLFGLRSTRNETFTRELASLASRATRGDAGAAIAFLRKAACGQDAVVDDAEALDAARRQLG